ncbi:unnamed protein product [Phytophthora lilii]|uniref:Unnamed protein product n=1 Tax=Phytophthora lilii TaxID=2077276 RepID=A0A9W6U9K9_9STRA|nr:unnamed protein product [Phytophthora lilii]
MKSMKIAFAVILARLTIYGVVSDEIASSPSNLRSPTSIQLGKDTSTPSSSHCDTSETEATSPIPTVQAPTTQPTTTARDPLNNPCLGTGASMTPRSAWLLTEINVQVSSFNECCNLCWADPTCRVFVFGRFPEIRWCYMGNKLEGNMLLPNDSDNPLTAGFSSFS